MTKLVLEDLQSLTNEQAAIDSINTNNDTLETFGDTLLSLDGSTPNTMSADIDMDGNQLLNLSTPTLSTQAATKGYVDTVAAFADSGDITASVTAAAASATAAAASETAAATSATDAAASAGKLQGTSADSVLIATGSKAFTTQASKFFTTGTWLLIVSAANVANYMHGQSTAYAGTALTVNVTNTGGSGTFSDWIIFVSGTRGATGAAGATVADYTADAELNALSSLTATPGLMTQTADNVFNVRTLTGTANLITVTNGDGVAGNPTITVGSNVVRKDTTSALTIGYTQTPYDHGTLSGTVGITPLPSLGAMQKASISAAAVLTINAPTTEEGMCVLELTNTGSPTSVTFASFDKTLLGATFSLTAAKVHWIYIYSLNTHQAYQIVTIV